MISLPHDLNRHILSYVDRKTYENVRKTCKYLRDLTSKDQKWVSLLKLAFNETSDTPFATLLKKKVLCLKDLPQTIATFPPGKAHVMETKVALIDQMRSMTLYNFSGEEIQSAIPIPPNHKIINSRFIQKNETLIHLPTGQKFIRSKLHGSYLVQDRKASFTVYSTHQENKKIFEIFEEVEEYTIFGDCLVYTLDSSNGLKSVKIVDLETGTVFDPVLKWPDHAPEYDFEDCWIIEHHQKETVLTDFISGKSYPLDSREYRGAGYLSSRYVSLSTKNERFSYYDLKLKKTVHTNFKTPSITYVIEEMFFLIYDKELKAYHPEERRLYSVESTTSIKQIVSVKWPFILLKSEEKFQIFHLPSSKLLNDFDSKHWIFRSFQEIFFKKEGQPLERRAYPVEI